MRLLTRNEELLLLCVWKLRDDAYGLSVREKLSTVLNRDVSVGAVYVPLERLVRKGLLKSKQAPPTDERGGRRTRYYSLTPKGVSALSNTETVRKRAWEGHSIEELKATIR